MKTETLPLYRDGARLVMFNPSHSIRTRRRVACDRRAWRRCVWQQADGWRYRKVDDSLSSPLMDAWKRLTIFESGDVSCLADAIFVLIESPGVEVKWSGDEIRPLLSDRERTRQLLVASAHKWSEAVDILHEKKLVEDDTARRLLRRVPRHDYCIDPFAFVRFGFTQDILELSWTEIQVRSFLPFFRGGRVRTIRRMDRIMARFIRENEKDLVKLQRFLLDADSRFSAGWLEFASHFKKQNDRFAILDFVRAAKSPARIPLDIGHSIRDRVDRIGIRKFDIQPCWVHDQTGLGRSISIDLYRLADFLKLDRIPRVDLQGAKYRPDTELFRELAVDLRKNESAQERNYCDGSSRVAFQLWRGALRRKPVCDVIHAVPWNKHCPDGAKTWAQLVDTINDLCRADSHFLFLCEWVEQSTEEIPVANRLRFLEYLYDIVSDWDYRPSRIRRTSTVAFARSAASGFEKTQKSLVRIFQIFARRFLPDQLWTLGGLPRSALKQMERKGRSHSATERIEAGVESLFAILPETDTGLLFSQPSQFLKALENLGSLGEADRERVLHFLEDHPALGFDPRRIALDDAAILCADLVPEELRDGATLRTDRLAHYRAEFCRTIASHRLRILIDETERVRNSKGNERFDNHTLRFLSCMDKTNRRALKKFLHAAESGCVDDYRERHPLNRAWVAKHPGLPVWNWVAGGSGNFPPQCVAGREFRVRLEFDPEEELKMGTYVNSCLSTGGCNAASAVTNTFDINKRVAYLLDDDGKVVARQLIAISEEEKLVPFTVYHTQHRWGTQEIEDCFVRYDAWLATELGIALWKEDEDYSIHLLVGNDWYDDGAWERPGKLYAHRFSDSNSVPA